MRKSEASRSIFWRYRAEEITLKELYEEVDKLNDKQEHLDFKGGLENGKEGNK